jgi:hypothetical protein
MLMPNGAVSGSMSSDSRRRWRPELANSPPPAGSRGATKEGRRGNEGCTGQWEWAVLSTWAVTNLAQTYLIRVSDPIPV